MNAKFLPLLLLPLPFLSSCRTTGEADGTNLKVTNGIEAGAPKEIPMLSIGGQGICTGTFVNPTTLLTAAHCVLPNQAGGGISVGGIKSIKYFINPKFEALKAQAGVAVSSAAPVASVFAASAAPIIANGESATETFQMYDLAVVVFPEGTGQQLGIEKYRSVADAAAQVGTDVYINGYGNNNQEGDGAGAGTYRIGTNKVSEIETGLLLIRGKLKTDGFANGAESAAGSGDSGGPLLSGDGKVFGTVSTGGMVETDPGFYYNIYVDVNSQQSKALFATAINCQQAPCAANFGGSGIPGGEIGGEGCLSAEESFVLALLLAAVQQAGDQADNIQLTPEQEAAVERLVTRFQQFGACEGNGPSGGNPSPLLPSSVPGTPPAAFPVLPAAGQTPLTNKCIPKSEARQDLKKLTAKTLSKEEAKVLYDKFAGRKKAGLCK